MPYQDVLVGDLLGGIEEHEMNRWFIPGQDKRWLFRCDKDREDHYG
jgi:hypothetical protein